MPSLFFVSYIGHPTASRLSIRTRVPTAVCAATLPQRHCKWRPNYHTPVVEVKRTGNENSRAQFTEKQKPVIDKHEPLQILFDNKTSHYISTTTYNDVLKIQ